MCACIADLFDLEKLSKELIRHSPYNFVQEQVLVDRVQICLHSEASRLNVLADDFDVLRRVFYLHELKPVDFVHLGCVELVIPGLNTTD